MDGPPPSQVSNPPFPGLKRTVMKAILLKQRAPVAGRSAVADLPHKSEKIGSWYRRCVGSRGLVGRTA
jgi:hypothetical protein